MWSTREQRNVIHNTYILVHSIPVCKAYFRIFKGRPSIERDTALTGAAGRSHMAWSAVSSSLPSASRTIAGGTRDHPARPCTEDV